MSEFLVIYTICYNIPEKMDFFKAGAFKLYLFVMSWQSLV